MMSQRIPRVLYHYCSLSTFKNIFDNEDEILNIAKTLIINAIDAVCESNFKIHPLKIEKKKDGCEYCDYKDICFVKNKDLARYLLYIFIKLQL